MKQEIIAILISEFLGLPKDSKLERKSDKINSGLTEKVFYGINYELECMRGEGEFTAKHIEGEDNILYYGFYPEEMRFHLSWDWLSLAIIKAREIWNSEVVIDNGIGTYFVEIFNNLDLMDLDATYLAVVDFIEFYNDKNRVV